MGDSTHLNRVDGRPGDSGPQEISASKDEREARASKPAEDAMKYHPLCKGKIQTAPKCFVRDLQDFAIWYTPGVAAPCKAIEADPEKVYEYTNKGNTVAVISDGTRVLGLGDIGPAAAIPVMEGKALIYKYLGGVDAVPICLNTKKPEEFIRTVQLLEPCFGGINLEDIAQPKCFEILDTLRATMGIPVWHDDQQGTASVTLAGVINALLLVNKKINDVQVAIIGAGAASVCTARLLFAMGLPAANVRMVDSKGILHAEREDIKSQPVKWEIAKITNGSGIIGGIPEAMEGADVTIALSSPGPGVIRPEWVRRMEKDAIVFACANPTPEIWPWEAKEAGARIVATGRSDFPNQINNSLGFPGIFRGALDVRAKTITDEMCIEASMELARCAQDRGLDEEHIVPTMDDWEVFPREAAAVGLKAIEQGVALRKASRQELLDQAEETIRRARRMTGDLMEKGYIEMPR